MTSRDELRKAMDEKGVSPEDRKQIERFADFLRFAGPVPTDGTKRIVSEETWQYMQGEDVDPTPLPDGA